MILFSGISRSILSIISLFVIVSPPFAAIIQQQYRRIKAFDKTGYSWTEFVTDLPKLTTEKNGGMENEENRFDYRHRYPAVRKRRR